MKEIKGFFIPLFDVDVETIEVIKEELEENKINYWEVK